MSVRLPNYFETVPADVTITGGMWGTHSGKPCPMCKGTGQNPSTKESPAVKSARSRRLRRALLDEELAVELASLVRSGFTTPEARRKMGVGHVRSQRIRAVAVAKGFLRPRQRCAGTRGTITSPGAALP